MSVFIRSLAIGLGIGFIIILMQYPIGELAFKFIKSGPESVNHVKTYFRILYGEHLLFGYVLHLRWFIGMQNARIPMVIAILNNILNIVLSVCFVFGLGMSIEV